MNLVLKLAVYLLLISTFDNTLTIPIRTQIEQDAEMEMRQRDILLGKVTFARIRRQGPVVQPDWNSDQGFQIFQDFDVKVTDRKLKETEAIRGKIQDTVEKDAYAVELDATDFAGEGNASVAEPAAQSNGESVPQAEPESKSEPAPEPTPAPEPAPAPEPEPIPVPELQPTAQPENPHNKSNKPLKKLKMSSKGDSTPFTIWLRKLSLFSW